MYLIIQLRPTGYEAQQSFVDWVGKHPVFFVVDDNDVLKIYLLLFFNYMYGETGYMHMSAHACQLYPLEL